MRANRRTFTRRAALAIGLGAAGSLLAACASAPTSPTTVPAANPTPAPQPTTAPAVAPTSAAAAPTTAAATTPAAGTSGANTSGKAPVEIRLGSWAGSTVLDVIKNETADFQSRNPGITVKLEVAPWQDYWDKMQVQVAGGTTPDIVWMSGATFLDLNAKGAFRDLTPWSMSDKELNLKEMWNEPLYTAEGKLWAIPYTASVAAMFYNKTMLKDAGVAEPPTDWNDPGWTWDDFRKACQAVTTAKGKDGKPHWGVQLNNAIQWGWGTWILCNGAKVLKKDLSESTVDSPEFIGAIQFIVDLIHKDKVSPVPGDPSTAVGPGLLDLFNAGQVAFDNDTNNSRIPTYLQVKSFEWDACVPPRAAAGKPRQVYWVQNPYCMSSASKTPDEAWKFLAYIASKPGQDFMGTTKLIMPSLKAAAYDTNTYLKPPPNNTKLFPTALDNNFTTDLQFTKNWLRYTQVAKEQLDPAYLGEKPVADACKNAKREIDKVLKGA
jgi:multiple sugar transport system substrate-binding protein